MNYQMPLTPFAKPPPPCKHYNRMVVFEPGTTRSGVETCKDCGAKRSFDGAHDEEWKEP